VSYRGRKLLEEGLERDWKKGITENGEFNGLGHGRKKRSQSIIGEGSRFKKHSSSGKTEVHL